MEYKADTKWLRYGLLSDTIGERYRTPDAYLLPSQLGHFVRGLCYEDRAYPITISHIWSLNNAVSRLAPFRLFLTKCIAPAAVTVEEFAKANGQILLPLVELVTQARVAVDEVIDRIGRHQAVWLPVEVERVSLQTS